VRQSPVKTFPGYQTIFVARNKATKGINYALIKLGEHLQKPYKAMNDKESGRRLREGAGEAYGTYFSMKSFRMAVFGPGLSLSRLVSVCAGRI